MQSIENYGKIVLLDKSVSICGCAERNRKSFGGFMSREAILKVKETERAAADMIRDARVRAEQMRQAAEAEGQEICRLAEAEELERRRELMEQLCAKTEELSEHSAQEAREAADEMLAEVRLRRKIAEKIIIRGLDSKCR